jgi:hypothetical protein
MLIELSESWEQGLGIEYVGGYLALTNERTGLEW